jgi:hypothetical protein
LRDEAFNLDRIALQNLSPLLFEAQEKIDIANDAALERFIQAGAKLAIGERVQNSGSMRTTRGW